MTRGGESSGSLYVVATPIGNLEDITLRALRVLKEVDVILCEDTRVTQKLLNKYHIKKQLVSLHKFNENKNLERIIFDLRSGKNIALVSDAGTPLVSDPGKTIVYEARTRGIKVYTVPGPSALASALSVFGMNGNDFLFLGFLPLGKSKRQIVLKSLCTRARNVVIYIAPHDFKKYVKEIYDLYPDVEVFYAREMTKVYEEVWSGNIQELISKLDLDYKLKGEIVLGLHFRDEKSASPLNERVLLTDLKENIAKGLKLKEASKIVSNKHKTSSKKLYDLYVKKNK